MRLKHCKPCKVLVLAVFFLSLMLKPNISSSQNIDNYLSYNKKGEVFDSRMKKLDNSQIKYFLKDYPRSRSIFKKAKTYQLVGNSLIYSSLAPFALSVSLYENSYTSNDKDKALNLSWIFLGSACALMGTGLIVRSGYKKNIKKAIDNYNDAISSGKHGDKLAINVGFTSEGLGVVVRF